MLSLEAPPPDSPGACEISQLKSISSESDDRAPDKIASPGGVDLSKSLAKFSIREYVFSARSKDIKTNWPFSSKNLQLCLKHGVKELLPPFQSINSVSNRSLDSCTAETSLIHQENITNSDALSNCFVSVPLDDAGSNCKLTSDCVNIDLSGSDGDKDHTLTTSNQSNSSEVSGEKLEKSENTNQPPVKKCRLIVKVGGETSSNEDNPEPMASKVCPVCKTFSSSSNTTLNAHIDQCLTVESTVKWKDSNLRVIKHRIKLRKTRLMVDIYATAKHCTLEELDRRNGTNWSVNCRLPFQENTECAGEEKQRVFPFASKDSGEGAVYIDANGKKVRILSKFNDKPPRPKADAKPSKPFGDRGGKLLLTQKKRHYSHKHNKYLKLTPCSKKLCFSKSGHISKIRGDLPRNFASKEIFKKVESLTGASFKVEEQTKLNDSGTIVKWACSKRSSLLKRCNYRQELSGGSDQSSLVGTNLGRSCIQKTRNPSKSPLSSPESSKRMENSSFSAPIGESYRNSSVKKRVFDMKNFLEPLKCNVKQLRREDTSLIVSCKDVASSGENHVPSPGNKSIGINALSVQTSSHDVCSSPKNKLIWKCLAGKKSKGHSMEQFDDGSMPLPNKIVGSPEFKEKNAEKHSRAEEIMGQLSLQRSSVLEIRKKKRGAFSIRDEEQAAAMKSTLDCHSYCMDNKIKSSGEEGADLEDTSDGMKTVIEGVHREDTVNGLSSGLDVDKNVLNSSKPSHAQFHDEQKISHVNGVCNNIIAKNTRMEAEKESGKGSEKYSTGVDPILIPELTESFLPSPRDMGLEDLQGNSSLTTSQVQTSENHHDDIERDSSYSPISAISTLSTVARSGSKSSEKLSGGPLVAQVEIRSAGCRHAAIAESTTPVSPASDTQEETINLDESKVTYEVGQSKSLKNDQSCQCSWKDAASVSLNYQESQLLKRRTMALGPVPPMGYQQNSDHDRRKDGLNSLPEMASLGGFTTSGPDQIILSTVKSAERMVPLEVSADSAVKPSIHGECDSISPSTSNPILRLMGKNLMVVNKEDNVSQHFCLSELGSHNNTPSPQFQTLTGVSTHDIQQGDVNPFCHMLHQNLPLPGRSQCNDTYFDIKSLKSFGSHFPSNTLHTPSYTLMGMFSSNNMAGGSAASLESKVGYSLPADQNRLRNGPSMPSPSCKKNVVTTPVIQHTNANSGNDTVKEVIIIDDSPEEEAASSEGMKRTRVSPSAASYNSSHASPFYNFQPQNSSLYYRSPFVKSTRFQLPPHSRVNGIPIKWNYTLEGPNVLPPSSLMAPSSSASHVRYHSSSLS